MAVGGPFGKLDLGDEARFDPNTAFHLLLGERPGGAPLFGKVCEGAFVCDKRLEFLKNLAAHALHKAVSHFGGEAEAVPLAVADDERIERMPRHVAADHQLLRATDLAFHPIIRSLSRLVKRALALGDDAFKAKLPGRADQIVRFGFKRFGQLDIFARSLKRVRQELSPLAEFQAEKTASAVD